MSRCEVLPAGILKARKTSADLALSGLVSPVQVHGQLFDVTTTFIGREVHNEALWVLTSPLRLSRARKWDAIAATPEAYASSFVVFANVNKTWYTLPFHSVHSLNSKKMKAMNISLILERN